MLVRVCDLQVLDGITTRWVLSLAIPHPTDSLQVSTPLPPQEAAEALEAPAEEAKHVPLLQFFRICVAADTCSFAPGSYFAPC